MSTSEPVVRVESEVLSEADRRLEALFDRLEAESIAALEGHARHIVTLTTTLMAAFFGLLSLSDRPAFLANRPVQVLALLTLVLFFLALAFALDALLPRRYAYPDADLTARREVLARLLARKEQASRRATFAFGAAMLSMLTTTLVVLFFG